MNCLSLDERSLLLKRIRQREWVARKRRENPEKYLEAARAWKRKATTMGYWKKGGGGYRGTISSEKRRAYFRWYNEHVRRPRAASRGAYRLVGRE